MASGPSEDVADGGNRNLIYLEVQIYQGGLGGQTALTRCEGDVEKKLCTSAFALVIPMCVVSLWGVL